MGASSIEFIARAIFVARSHACDQNATDSLINFRKTQTTMVPEELRKTRLERAARLTGQETVPPATPDVSITAAKADDLVEIKKTVEDAATVSGGLWLSYLFVLFYIAVAAGSVTHVDLLLENPVKLPFLNIELPLRAFFFLTPLLFLTTHTYALMHFRMLGLKALRFHDELKRQLPDGEDDDSDRRGVTSPKDVRDKLRRLLPSNIFVQMLAGPPELRGGMFGVLLKFIALVTLVLFPVSLLLLLQIQFLPYHDWTIIWVQRGALFFDIIALWILRPPPLPSCIGCWKNDGSRSSFSTYLALGRRAIGLCLSGGVLSAVPIWFSFIVTTIPGEWQETVLADLDPLVWRVTYVDQNNLEKTKLVSTREHLFAEGVDPITLRRNSLFSNTLVLPGFNLYEALKIDDPKKLDWKDHLIDLRGRHLERAVLDDATLVKANLNGAHLEGVSLDRAHLQGASLYEAWLQGASLGGAELQGAMLGMARLQGAYLRGAALQGASLASSRLEGAHLDKADLQGASLVAANLQGASLTLAQLQGAWLDTAEIQGAQLTEAEIRTSDFSNSFLWRAQFQDLKAAEAAFMHFENVTWEPVTGVSPAVQWTAERYAHLRQSIEAIPVDEARSDALESIEELDCDNPDKMLASCDLSAPLPSKVRLWREILTHANVNDATYRKALAKTLQEVVCTNGANGTYILRGMIESKRLLPIEDKISIFVDAIMSKDCSAFPFLAEDDKTKLRALRKKLLPPEKD